jgi:hypothetical protein
MIDFDGNMTHGVRDTVAKVVDAGVHVVVATGRSLTATFPILEELLDVPATRVVVRSPSHTPEEFLELTERIGLHGVNYAVGWTAWLDLAPEGVS